MVLWWLANALLLLVVIPFVAILLYRLRQPVFEIRDYAADVLEHGVLAIKELDAVDELVETREQVAVVKEQLAAYVGHVSKILA